MRKMAKIIYVLLFCAGALFAQSTLQDSLVLYWSFDNIENGVVPPYDGMGQDGIIMGDTWSLEEGWMGNALNLVNDDKDTNYVTILDTNFCDIHEDITLCCWVYQRDCANDQHNPWITKGDQAFGLKHRGVQDADDNRFEFFIHSGGGWQTAYVASDEAFNGAWHHFVGVFDGEGLYLYVDGELLANTVFSGTIKSWAYPVEIGRNSQKHDRTYDGIIDEVRIYSRGLSPEEVIELYNLPTTPVKQENKIKPESFNLEQNYPNPFNPTTTISYVLPNSEYIKLTVFDASGKKVQTLVNGLEFAGNHTATFDASELASGIYFYQLKTGNTIIDTKKMLLVR